MSLPLSRQFHDESMEFPLEKAKVKSRSSAEDQVREGFATSNHVFNMCPPKGK